MKTLTKIALVALISMPMMANATERRPDVQYNIINSSNRTAIFHASTSCADLPGTITVAPKSTYSIWGEPMNHNNCTYTEKQIYLTLEGDDFNFNTYAQPDYAIPTHSGRWKFKLNGTPRVGLGDSHYNGNDLILLFNVSQYV